MLRIFDPLYWRLVKERPFERIRLVWHATLAVVASFVVVGIAVAARVDEARNFAHRGVAFAMVWSAALLAGVGAFGTSVLRRGPARTALHRSDVGAWLGATATASQTFFVLFALFANLARRNDLGGTTAAHRGAAAFCFFAFAAMTSTTLILARERAALLRPFDDDPAALRARADVEGSAARTAGGVELELASPRDVQAACV